MNIRTSDSALMDIQELTIKFTQKVNCGRQKQSLWKHL